MYRKNKKGGEVINDDPVTMFEKDAGKFWHNDNEVREYLF